MPFLHRLIFLLIVSLSSLLETIPFFFILSLLNLFFQLFCRIRASPTKSCTNLPEKLRGFSSTNVLGSRIQRRRRWRSNWLNSVL